MGREKKAAKAEPEEQQYLYKDPELRLKRSNRLVFIASVVICICISLYLVLRMMWRETDRPMLPQIANWITILAMIVNIVTYCVKKYKNRFRVTNAISLGIVYVAVMFLTDATFIYWILVAILFMNLTYYDWGYSKNWLSFSGSVL